MTELSGLTSETTCANLTELASHVAKRHHIVEIGTFRGKSACALAREAQAHVTTIDPWWLDGNPGGRYGFNGDNLPKVFAEQVAAAGLESKITQWQTFSVDAAANWNEGEVGLLFIDGDHSYEAVRADYNAWKVHLAYGALVVFDDVDTPRNPGVRQFFDEVELDGKHILQDNLGVGTYVG